MGTTNKGNGATETYMAVRACAVALLAGAVLQADAVSAGNGLVIDWRTVKCGDVIQSDGDAFDTAQLFVALVGSEAALSSTDGAVAPPDAFVEPAARVAEYMRNNAGARRRSFDAGPFRVFVEPHDDDDEAQSAFTRRLADLAGAALKGGAS